MSETILARCVRGLEWVVAGELASRFPDATITLAPRSVGAAVPALDRQLLDLRTADDMFVELGAVSGVGTTKDVPPLLSGRLARLDWAGLLGRLREVRAVPDRFRFDVVTSIDGKRNFNRYAVENALGPLLAPVLGGRYLPRTGDGQPGGEPDVTVRVFLDGSRAVAAVRLGARPLHRRGYKQDTGPGTLHPPLAAALVRLAAPAPGELLLDPFCGDGTVAIEAALGWPGVPANGSDLDPDRVAHARANARRAGVTVDWSVADAGAPDRPDGSVDVLVTNPPWNLAVDARGRLVQSLEPFWRNASRLLSPTGRLVVVAGTELDADAALRRTGLTVTLSTQVRLAGRVSRICLCGPLPADLATWRRRAQDAGVITEEGF